MDANRLRAWWWHRQALDGRFASQSPGHVLAATGWARSVAGAGPYLGLLARCGVGRNQVDEAVANLAIHELPSARGCTYVVPASDFALALKVGQAFVDGDMAGARKLGVTDQEVDKLGIAVISALRAGPLEPDQIRTAVGGATRSLGEAGKKKGITSTLPLALGRLQAAGEIRRIPTNGRLDQQRYRYAIWQPNPLARYKASPEESNTELARRYFDWTAPATLAEFQWFSGLSVRAAKAAVASLDLEPIEPNDERLLPGHLRSAYLEFVPPPKPQYALVSSLDAVLLLRRNVKSLLAGADQSRQLPVGAGACQAAGSLTDLPSPAILDRGRIVGLWEYSPEDGEIVWMSLVKADAALREAISRTEAFVRDQLGDARTFSLDSPKSRAPRIAGLRAANSRVH